MERIGVFFIVPQEYEDLKIESILKFINIEDYKWHITTNDVFVRNDDWKQTFLEGEEVVSGLKLKEELREKDYYPIFLNLRAYPNDLPIQEIHKTPITNLQEFIQSKCVLMLVIIDCGEVGIFVKDPSYLTFLNQDILSKGYEEFRFIKTSEDWYFS
ncbi:DUF2691 family protein [Neobacillus sp. PS2-9]|uniref:DUF2691 family protein n=1 Tax=Neobacillus sp. PS2-9 TaxID=3070676 RepID=UPI0027DF5E30|nr:DUF2691 family protein [Neobacillus sp. PS2-9]WML58093.1 DUF2691 family protein [Neobacillus sp. PS2-9]